MNKLTIFHVLNLALLVALSVFLSRPGISAEPEKGIPIQQSPEIKKLKKKQFFKRYAFHYFKKNLIYLNISDNIIHSRNEHLGSWTELSGGRYTIHINPKLLAKTYVLDWRYSPFTPSLLRAIIYELAFIDQIESFKNKGKISLNTQSIKEANQFLSTSEGTDIQTVYPKAKSRLKHDSYKCLNMFGLKSDLNYRKINTCPIRMNTSQTIYSKKFTANSAGDKVLIRPNGYCDKYDLNEMREKYFKNCPKMIKNESYFGGEEKYVQKVDSKNLIARSTGFCCSRDRKIVRDKLILLTFGLSRSVGKIMYGKFGIENNVEWMGEIYYTEEKGYGHSNAFTSNSKISVNAYKTNKFGNKEVRIHRNIDLHIPDKAHIVGSVHNHPNSGTPLYPSRPDFIFAVGELSKIPLKLLHPKSKYKYIATVVSNELKSLSFDVLMGVVLYNDGSVFHTLKVMPDSKKGKPSFDYKPPFNKFNAPKGLRLRK